MDFSKLTDNELKDFLKLNDIPDEGKKKNVESATRLFPVLQREGKSTFSVPVVDLYLSSIYSYPLFGVRKYNMDNIEAMSDEMFNQFAREFKISTEDSIDVIRERVIRVLKFGDMIMIAPSQITDVPSEIIQLVLGVSKNMSVQDILSFCSTNKQFSEVCKSPEFWNSLAVDKYGVSLDTPLAATSAAAAVAALSADDSAKEQYIKVLTEAGDVDFGSEKYIDIDEALQRSAMRGNSDLVNHFIAFGADPQEGLNNAAEYGHMDIVKIIIEAGALVFTENIIAAIRGNHREIVIYFVGENYGNMKFIADESAVYDSDEVFKLVLRSGTDMDIQDSYLASAKNGSFKIVKMVLPLFGNYKANEASQLAISNGHYDVFEYILEHTGDYDVRALIKAKRLDTVPGAIASIAERNNPNEMGDLAYNNYLPELQEIKDMGVNLNYNIILNAAAKGGHDDIVTFALDNGASDFRGGIAAAAEGNNATIVQRMITAGATDFEGGLAHAAFNGNEEIIDTMIGFGARNYNTALNEAARGGRIDVVFKMVEEGANQYGLAFYLAVKNDHPIVAETILDIGQNQEVIVHLGNVSDYYDQAITKAIENENVEMVIMLIDHGVRAKLNHIIVAIKTDKSHGLELVFSSIGRRNMTHDGIMFMVLSLALANDSLSVVKIIIKNLKLSKEEMIALIQSIGNTPGIDDTSDAIRYIRNFISQMK